jgi:hypothetical protein
LNTVNHDAVLTAQAAGPDGTVGFVALPSGGPANQGHGHDDIVANVHLDHSLGHLHMWG